MSVRVVYDAGVLIAAERGDRLTWGRHEAAQATKIIPVTTAAVVAQVSRSGRQAQLRRFLQGCVVVGFEGRQAHAVGRLLAATGSSDVVDAHVVLVAGELGAPILTSDPGDLEPLAAALDAPVAVIGL